MLKNINIISIIILLYFISNIYCQNLIDNEIQCIKDLAIKLNNTNINVPDIETKICLENNFAKCHQNGSLSELNLASATRNNLTNTDLNCFPSLVVFKGSLLYFEPNFLYEPNPSIKEIFITSQYSIDSITQVIPKLDRLSIGDILNPINANFLKNVTSFSMFGGTSDFIVEGDQSDSNLKYIYIFSKNVPMITALPKLDTLSIYATEPFNQSSMVNLDIEKLTSLSLSGVMKIDFPTQFMTAPNQKWNYLYIGFEVVLNPVNQLIDLSNNKVGTNVVIFLSSAKLFNYNGQFPFKALPKAMFQLVIQNGNFSVLPNLEIFQNVSYLELSSSEIGGTLPSLNREKTPLRGINLRNNKLEGTVDASWCKIGSLDFSNNLLSGLLPDCFYCYLNMSSLAFAFKNNNFDNYSPLTASCDYSKISITSIKITGYMVTLYGKNFATNLNNIVSTPKINFYQDLYNDTVYGILVNPILVDVALFEIRFLIPGINFTIPINIDTPPVITSIQQSNATFTIDGSYFSYDSSVISVKIGNNVCQVTHCTFYQIQCNIGYPVSDSGNKNVEVKVNAVNAVGSVFVQYTPIPCAIPNCNGNGICNDRIGQCKCDSKWTTISEKVCTIPNHYVSSSTQIQSNTAGNITIYGWFGDEHSSLQVLIGGQAAIIFSSNSDSMLLSINAGVGSKKITVIQNGLTWTGLIFPYYDLELLCPNDCGSSSNKGTCNKTTGECKCASGFSGLDCLTTEKKSLLPITYSSILSSGQTLIANEQNGFEISIDSIIETDFNGNDVYKAELSKTWKFEGEVNSISTFSQVRNNASIVLSIEQVKQDNKQYSFAGNQFTINNGGIKISLSINDWDYKNTLNTLSVQMSSNITTVDNDEPANNCNDDQDTSIESSSNSASLSNNLNYLKFTAYGKVLYGRFQDKMLSDDRPTTVITNLVSKDDKLVKISLSLPYCKKCILDPDFSVLVSPDFKSSDSCHSNKKSWLIPVAVVVPVLGVVIIIIVAIVLVKKNSVNLRIGMRNFSMRSFKDNSKK